MTYAFGEVVLVPFPFTDQSGLKKRPAVVVSSSGYNANRRDLIIMAITSKCGSRQGSAKRWSPTGRPQDSLNLQC